METRPIFALLALLALLATAAAFAEAFAVAYTWTDENGIVHYSDRPEPGATIIDLGERRFSRPRPTTRSTATTTTQSSENSSEPSGPGYSSLEIASPGAEETLWNIEATLSVSLTLMPALKPGHQVRAYFDGTPQIVSGTNFQIGEVYRGVHNLQVEVIDETGKLMIRSQPNRFYVQQNAVR
jgi:hypothetical protein